AEDLGGADVHTAKSGVADHYAETEEEGLEMARNIVATLNYRPKHPGKFIKGEVTAPLYPAEEIYGIIPKDTRKPFDVREIIARLVDGSEFQEFKERY